MLSLAPALIANATLASLEMLETSAEEATMPLKSLAACEDSELTDTAAFKELPPLTTSVPLLERELTASEPQSSNCPMSTLPELDTELTLSAPLLAVSMRTLPWDETDEMASAPVKLETSTEAQLLAEEIVKPPEFRLAVPSDTSAAEFATMEAEPVIEISETCSRLAHFEYMAKSWAPECPETASMLSWACCHVRALSVTSPLDRESTLTLAVPKAWTA